MREVELKAVSPHPDRTVAALRAAGAVPLLDGRLRDARYDTPDGALVARDLVLRLRVFEGDGGSSASLDWKGPTTRSAGYKVRDEISVRIDDAGELAAILGRLGYEVIGEIDRRIWQCSCCGATVRVERYPRMDALVEVEGEPASIEAAIAATGLARSGFTPDRLQDFVQRFEARTGLQAAVSEREFAGGHQHGEHG